jgi:hypothetical protein
MGRAVDGNREVTGTLNNLKEVKRDIWFCEKTQHHVKIENSGYRKTQGKRDCHLW